MPSNTKEVKQRLGTIKNTQKITKAMELVAAAKMRKAVEAALLTRAYHTLIWDIVNRIQHSQLYFATNNPVKRFFEPVDEKGHTTIIVFTSNRGLCGAFNSNIVKSVTPYIKESASLSVISVGNKGTIALTMLGAAVDLAYKKDDAAISDESVTEIVGYAYKKFKNKETDRVLVAYTDYKSAITQQAVVKQLFPILDEPQVGLGESDVLRKDTGSIHAPMNQEYLYEPGKYELLDYLLPRLASAQLYQALLESNASEHSARMVAMKNASESASDIARELLLEYNKARQAAITQEIAEISAGRAAVS